MECTWDGKGDVLVFQRYDLEDSPECSDHELAKRWRTFHRAVRANSSSRLVRLIGPFLGDDTRRRRLLLKLQSVLAPQHPRPTAPTSRPRSLPRYEHLHPAGELSPRAVTDVAVAVVGLDDATAAVRSLNELVASSDRQWLYLCDASTAPATRANTLSTLWRHATAGVVFADEDGPHADVPLLKCDLVGTHTLLSFNQVGRPALLPLAEVRRVGGFRPEAGVAFEHDLYLRLDEAGVAFTHVPEVLGGGRIPADFTHDDLGADTARIVRDALERRGVVADVRPGPVPSVARWDPHPDAWPLVSIVIPTRDRCDLLARCVASVEAVTDYPSYEIVLLDNDSIHDETLAYFAQTRHRVVACPGPFNYAAIMNRGVATTAGAFVVTLNNDTVITQPDWLRALVGIATLPEVAIVGTVQVDEVGNHDHDGIVVAPYPQHLQRGRNYLLEDEWVQARRDVAAVTGAVQLVRRSVWDELGGMDETLAVVMNDVDLCLRAHSAGHDVVLAPDVEVIHYASSSRGSLDPIDDRNRFVRRWDVFGSLRDPYFPPTLRLLGTSVVYAPVAD